MELSSGATKSANDTDVFNFTEAKLDIIRESWARAPRLAQDILHLANTLSNRARHKKNIAPSDSSSFCWNPALKLIMTLTTSLGQSWA